MDTNHEGTKVKQENGESNAATCLPSTQRDLLTNICRDKTTQPIQWARKLCLFLPLLSPCHLTTLSYGITLAGQMFSSFCNSHVKLEYNIYTYIRRC